MEEYLCVMSSCGRAIVYHWSDNERYQEAGIDLSFVQDNHSRSQRGVLRGLHLQRPRLGGNRVNGAWCG